MTDNEKKKKPASVKPRRSMAEKFAKERGQILNSMNEILGLGNGKSHFFVDDIDEDAQKKITDFDEDIQKYFRCSKWSYFSNQEKKTMWLSLIKSFYKEFGYEVVLSSTHRKNSRSLCVVDKKDID